MKTLIASLLTLFLASQAFATLTLPEPDVLLQKAALSRADLRETIMEIELNIPEMRDPVTFDKYFYLLDNLQTYSNSLQLEQFYPEAVKDLANLMVDNGMRWLDIGKDPKERILYYIKWLSPTVLERFLGQVDYQLDTIKDLPRLRTSAGNIEAILPLVEKIAGANSYSLIGFRRLISSTAVAILRTQELPQDEKLYWIEKVQIPSEFSDYIESLSAQVYQIKAGSTAGSHSLLELLSRVTEKIHTLDSTPTFVAGVAQDLLIETLVRMLTYGEMIGEKEFQRALLNLDAHHVQSLSQTWISLRYTPSQKSVGEYLALVRSLIERASDLGLHREASDLTRWFARSSTSVVVRLQKLEGMYELRDKSGGEWRLTLVIARDNMVVGSISNLDRSIQRSLYNISYDSLNEKFVASDRETDENHERNLPVSIVRKSDGTIEVTDDFAIRPEYKLFTGRKTQSFPDTLSAATATPQSPKGVFEGMLNLPNGKTMNARLSISMIEGYLVAKLEDKDNSMFFADLTLGTNGADGVIHLLSGRNPGAGWLQLRGTLNGNTLKLQTVVAGVGLSAKTSTLQRVVN